MGNYGLDAGFSTLVEQTTRPNIYFNNPFRVLELPVDCTVQDIKRRQKMIEIGIKQNTPLPDGSGKIFPIQTSPDIFLYNDAIERLLDPEKRLVNEFFWFWPAVFGNSNQDDALLTLKDGNIDEAIEIWSSSSNTVAIHNLAILSHLLALDIEISGPEAKLSEPQIKSLQIYWSRVYRRWKQFLEEKSTWEYIHNRVVQINYPSITQENVIWLQDQMPLILLKMNATLAVRATEQNNKSRLAKYHTKIIDESGFAKAIQEQALTDSLQEIRERIKAFTAQAQQDAEKDPAHASNSAEHLIQTSFPSLQIISHILSKNSPLNVTVHDEVAFSLSQCIDIFINKTQNWDVAIRILEQALDLAYSNLAKDKIKRNLAACINVKAVNELNEMYGSVNMSAMTRTEALNLVNKLRTRLPELHSAFSRAAQLDPSNQTIRENLDNVTKELTGLDTIPLPGVIPAPSYASTSLQKPTQSPNFSSSVTYPSKPKIHFTPASIGKHLIAFFIDTVILLIIAAYNNLNTNQTEWLIFGYYFMLHLIFKRTFGEGLSGTRVVNRATLEPISGFSALFRAGFYVLIFYIWVYYWSWGFLLLFWPALSSERRGLHDFFTGNILVK